MKEGRLRVEFSFNEKDVVSLALISYLTEVLNMPVQDDYFLEKTMSAVSALEKLSPGMAAYCEPECLEGRQGRGM